MWSVLLVGYALSGAVEERAVAAMRPVPVTGDSPSTVPAWVVGETERSVQVVIHFPPGTDPGSIEVRLLGAKVTVVARNAEGSHIRSRAVHLREAPVENGATADYHGDGWLTVTLRKRKARPSAD
jgi:HSP20 family molecular chaperone IbpA